MFQVPCEMADKNSSLVYTMWTPFYFYLVSWGNLLEIAMDIHGSPKGSHLNI